MSPDIDHASATDPPPDPAQLQACLQAALSDCDALRREQQALAYGLSHDLHASLRVIDNAAWQLSRGDALPGPGQHQVARLREATARMAALLERLQVFMHAGTAPLERRRVDLSLLAEWIGADLQDAAPQRDLRLQVQPGLEAVGDERLLRTLLLQLLDNALRFSPDPVRIDVAGTREADTLQLRIRDHGAGFDMALAGKLGQPFQRLHAADVGGGGPGAGCGLGLAIARRIATRHGGALQLDSHPGDGTLVTVTLPDRGASR